MAATATIRVPVEVRDRLAAQANARGLSMASLIADYAYRSDLEVVYVRERQAAAQDAANPGWLEEMADWDAAIEDGVE